MAYMNQENKKKIAAELKKIIPSSWKWSLSVRHHSTLVLTIASAPVDLIEEAWKNAAERQRTSCYHNDPPQPKPTYYSPNEYYLDREFSGETLCTFQDIKNAMMTGNHDNSDAMTDYFDVGWYIDICIGAYDRPFKVAQNAAGMPMQLASAEPTMDELKARIAQLEARLVTSR
jgi:hypothetical protein